MERGNIVRYDVRSKKSSNTKELRHPKKYDSDADIPDDKIAEALTKLAVSVFASEDEPDLH